MTTDTDATFNIAGYKISEDFPGSFLQSGSPVANDINAFSQIHSLADLVSLASQTYRDAVHGGFHIAFENTNVLTGQSGISFVLTEGNNTIGTIGVSGPLDDVGHFIGTVLHS